MQKHVVEAHAAGDGEHQKARRPAASDTRFEIVMVKRSLAAANAIRAGNSSRRAMSRIMRSTGRCGDAGRSIAEPSGR